MQNNWFRIWKPAAMCAAFTVAAVASDVGFANMESDLVDMRNYPEYFGDHTGPKEVAADVKAMGFDIVSRANNHATSTLASGVNRAAGAGEVVEKA